MNTNFERESPEIGDFFVVFIKRSKEILQNRSLEAKSGH